MQQFVKDTIFLSQMGNKMRKCESNDFEKIRAETNFEYSEIEDWYRWYKSIVSDTPRNRMDIIEFKKIYSRMYPAGVEDKYVEHVFRSFDTNEDEEIDFREFMISLSATSRGTLSQKLEWAFKVYDINGDGFISRDEMLEIFFAMHKMMNDHDLSAREGFENIEALVDDIIYRFDTNHDGKISMEEFVEGSQNNPTIMSKLSKINRKSSMQYSTPVVM